MSALALSGLLTFVTCISLSVFVLIKNSKNSLNLIYAGNNIAVAAYGLFYFLWQISPDIKIATVWFKYLVASLILLNCLYPAFVFTLIGNVKRKSIQLSIFILINAYFLILCLNDQLYHELEERFDLGFWPNPTPNFDLFLIFWLITCFYGFGHLLYAVKSSSGLFKQQLKYVSIACAIGFLGGATNWPMWYGIYLPPYPNFAIPIYVGLIAYSIVRLRLMDINLLMRWGLAYGASIGFIALISVGIIVSTEKLTSSFFNNSYGLTSLILICVTVLIFDPLKRRIEKFVDKFLFRSPDFEKTILDIEKKVGSSDNLEQLASNLSLFIKKMWDVSHFGFAIWETSSSSFKLYPNESFKDQIITKTNKTIGLNDFLVRTLESERRLFKKGIVSEEELIHLISRSFPGERTTFYKIRRTMHWVGASICVPLVSDNFFWGFLILGNRSKDKLFNQEDKKFLSHISQLVTNRVVHIIYQKPESQQMGLDVKVS